MRRSGATILILAGLAAPARAEPPQPRVDAHVVPGIRGERAVFACRDAPDAVVELDAGTAITPFGVRPFGARLAATLVRRDGTITCNAAGTRGVLRLHAMQLRAVSPRLVRDDKGARVVITIDGVALGPRVGRDDDVYLVWRGQLVAAASLAPAKCPEAAWTNERVIVCVDPALARGRGAARVRVQSAGRLDEAGGAPVDFDALGATP